ncbi:hypothetical protein ACFL17_09260 [Pseudomonadota bacterium]
MGVTALNLQYHPIIAKINHMKDGRAGFSCYYQISGMKSKILIQGHWVETPYKRGRYTFGKTNCGKGLYRSHLPPHVPGIDTAYYRGVNGKAAYVNTIDSMNYKTKRRLLDIIGVNRFKAIAKKMLAQIEPRAVDCPK